MNDEWEAEGGKKVRRVEKGVGVMSDEYSGSKL